MAGYGQYCPVAMTAEIFAERWTPLVIRNIICGAHTFNEIQRGVPLMSRSLLSKRLKELQKAGVVERRAGAKHSEYHLTQAGEELGPVIDQLGAWGQRWVRSEANPGTLDPRVLMWDMKMNLDKARLPSRRTVIQFEFTDVKRGALKRMWLVLEPSQVDTCIKDPGFAVDLLVTTPLRTLTSAWMGDIPLQRALRNGEITVEGPRELVRAFPTWMSLSTFAGVDRPRRRAASVR